MSYQIIPVDPDTTALYYDQIVPLEGIEYLFTFLWSDRESCWYLSIGDQDGNPIAYGIRLVVNWPLLRRFTDSRLPPGLLVATDTSLQGADIAASSDLGSRVLLMYMTSDDPNLAAARRHLLTGA